MSIIGVPEQKERFKPDNGDYHAQSTKAARYFYRFEQSNLKVSCITDRLKTELQIACDVVRLLDGLSIEQADQALIHARKLLQTSQTVNAASPLLSSIEQNETALNFTTSQSR